MSVDVHPTAHVAPDVRLAPGTVVGPYAVLGPGVTVGAETRIGAHAVVRRDTAIGARCEVGPGAVLGGDPQDRRYGGEPTRLEIGDETRIREYSTINRGTTARGATRIGRRCYLMTYVHVAHDCTIEDDVTIANAVQLGGHVHVEAGAVLGGTAAVQQFVHIGTLGFVGGASRVVRDVPPYVRAAGDPLRLYGINTLALTRAGVPPATCLALKRAFRLLFNSDLTSAEAAALLRREGGAPPEVLRLLDAAVHTEREVAV